MFDPKYVADEISKQLRLFEDAEKRKRELVWLFCNAAGWRSLGFDSVTDWLDSAEKSGWFGIDGLRSLVQEWIGED